MKHLRNWLVLAGFIFALSAHAARAQQSPAGYSGVISREMRSTAKGEDSEVPQSLGIFTRFSERPSDRS